MSRTPLFASLLALALITAPAAAQQQPAPRTIDPKWMAVDSAARRVTFELIAGHTPMNGSLNFNGYKDGELTFVVPAGWTVVVNFVNKDGALPHSAEIIADQQPLPVRGVDPVFSGASTLDADQGTAAGGGKDSFRFVANSVGNYVVFCAVAGHGLGGMWARLKVDPSATKPSIIASPAPTGR
jgi:FtsP/CotA-like multicopper oxidase with cupredoxin domain